MKFLVRWRKPKPVPPALVVIFERDGVQRIWTCSQPTFIVFAREGETEDSPLQFINLEHVWNPDDRELVVDEIVGLIGG